MTRKALPILSAAFLLCFLAIGIPYWQTPYASMSLPNSLFSFGLLLTSIVAMVLCARGSSFLWTAAILGMSAPSVVAIRVIVDTVRDSSTHNLWPIEMAIAIFISFSIAGFAAMLGVLIRKIFKLGATKR
ncbi:MAG: hypothetical protein ACREO1_11620 [Arenimonas sp.]